MREIELTQNQVTQVDDNDYDWLNQWSWYALKVLNGYYAVRNSSRKDGKQKKILMHREILNLSNDSKIEVDHADRNKLNNQRINLRESNRSKNAINCVHINKTGYRGVSYNEKYNRFKIFISIKGKIRYFGYKSTAFEAAKKYNMLALKYHGEFAILNEL